MPGKVLSLRKIIGLEVPGVKLRDGHFHEFEASEIELIKKLVPKQYWGHVQLPIIITRRREMGPGVYVVSGSEANLFIIQSIIKEISSYDSWRITEDKDFNIYTIDLKKIRKELPTTSVVAFG